jgi:tether containing UBX domain for GLUT4
VPEAGLAVRELYVEVGIPRLMRPIHLDVNGRNRHSKKQLDLSLTYRLSGLHSGAQLELVQSSRSPTVVNIALQLPNNKRLTEKFPSSTSIWQVLRRFESGAGSSTPDPINITQRGIAQIAGDGTGAGRMYYEMPVIYVSNRELGSFVDLQKTLAQIGVSSGSHLLRLHYRNEGQPLEEAMAQITNYFKDQFIPPVAEASSTAQAKPETVPKQTTSPPTALDATEGVVHAPSGLTSEQPTATSESTPTGSSQIPTETDTSASTTLLPQKRTVTVYTPPTTDTPQAATQPFNDADYVPTVDHARTHQHRLNNLSRNQRLLSDAELEKVAAEKREKVAQVERVRVRVRLPDQAQIEDTFSREDTAADLFGFVQLALRHPEQSFTLKYTDAKGKHILLTSSKQSLIKDLGWTGSTLVYMQWGDDVPETHKREPSLNDEHLQQAKKLEVELPKEEQEEEKKGFSMGGLLGGKDKGKGKATGRADLESKLRGFLGKKK